MGSSKKEIGITVSKKTEFSEWYTQVVIKAELADYAPVKGLIVLRPDGYSMWEAIRDSLDKKLSKRGIRNGFLPILIPETLLSKEKKHFAGFNPEVYWVTHSGNNEIGDRLALRPTSETLAYSLYSKWIKSWRDLPLKINFWNTALRAEIKATKPFLRTSEFLWQEGHTAHATKEEAEEEVKKIMEIYKELAEMELSIPVVIGKKSESEKFVGANYTITMESIMPDGKALQMGTSHMLGQNFSKPFEIKFSNEKNIENFVWQTSWGVSWRLIGAMIMIHGDDKGMVLPPRVAPIQVVIIPIYYSKDEQDAVMLKVKEIKETLGRTGIRLHVDERDGLTPGFKFNDWEMKGIPIRVEIGPKDISEGKCVIVIRHDQTKSKMDFEKIENITDILDDVQKHMLKTARMNLEQQTKNIGQDYDKLMTELNEGGFIEAFWCGKEECEQKIKKDTGADIRAIINDTINEKCVCCKKDAKMKTLFAKGY